MAQRVMIGKAIVFLGVLLLLGVATGCQGPGNGGLRPVRIVTTFPDANSSIGLEADKPCKYADVMAFPEAKDKTRAYAELLLMPGDLLPLAFKGKYHEHVPEFWYLFRSEDRQPLVFSAEGPVVLLAGRPIYLDLNHPDASSWLTSHRPEELGTLRGVRLGGNADVDLPALKRLAHSGVLIECPRPFTFAREEDRGLVEAILAADPTGLILDDGTGLDRYLPRLKNLTHLIMGCPVERALPSLKDAARLQVLYLNLTAGHPSTGPAASQSEPAAARPEATPDLRPLGLDQLPLLHTLFLHGEGCGNIKNLSSLDELHALRHLTLADFRCLANLSSLPPLYDLTGLEVICDDDKRPVVGLVNLTRFQKLVKLSLFCEISEGSDLRPLASLKQLRILVLPKETVEKRKAEVDDLRKALPNCRIYGMCMGSRWILAILAAGVALGAVLRGRKGKRSRLAIA